MAAHDRRGAQVTDLVHIPSARRKMTNRRESPAIGFQHCGNDYRIGLGLREDGQCGEIFLNGAKEGSDYQAIMGDLATLTSLLLQHGYSTSNLARRLSNDGLLRTALTYAMRIENGDR